MSDFDQRLQRAIQRGQQIAASKQQAERERQLSEEQLRRIHSQARLELSEHIERCLAKIPQFMPGFQYETVVSDRGWGAAVSRDDLDVSLGARRNLFSRLELVVQPFSSAHVLELAARGTIRNKEIFNRSNYQRLVQLQLESLREIVDVWVVEFAELFAAQR